MARPDHGDALQARDPENPSQSASDGSDDPELAPTAERHPNDAAPPDAEDPATRAPGGTVVMVEETVDDAHASESIDSHASGSADVDDGDPIPATRNDPTAAIAGSSASTGSASKRWLAVAIFAAAAIAAGAYFYFAIWRYEPTAAFHVPEGANIVIRADAKAVALFKPVREHMWPLIFENSGGEKDRRIQRIADETGVSIPTDLRELMVASVDGVSWVALIGGKIPPGRFVDGLARVLKEEGLDGWEITDGWLVHAKGTRIGQATDGTVIIASHQEIADASMPRAATALQFGLEPGTDPTGAVDFRISHAAFKRIIRFIPDSAPIGPLRQIDEVSGTIVLADAPHITLRIEPDGEHVAEKLASELSGMFTKLGLVLLLVPSDLYGAKRAISDATVTAGEGSVRVHAPWPYEPLDEALKLWAETLRAKPPGEKQ